MDPNAVLKSVMVSFHTNDEDKDDDTNVTVVVRQSNGTIAAHISNGFGHFNDHSDNGPFNLQIFNPGTRGDLETGNVTIRVDADGNDTWRFNAVTELLFTDGSHLTCEADGLELTQDLQQQTFGIN